jgi:hypothetical protein
VNPKGFFAELKRRHVYKVAIAYAVVAWLLIQIATQVFSFFEIPNWGVRLIILPIVLGFPIALRGACPRNFLETMKIDSFFVELTRYVP